LHGDVLMWLMKTLLTSGCTNQRGAGQGGMVAAVGVSAFATPIVGVPVGIVVFLMLMGKFLSRR
ncbi:hypothetical protein ACM55P_21775, partial [Enterobacter hormaechei]